MNSTNRIASHLSQRDRCQDCHKRHAAEQLRDEAKGVAEFIKHRSGDLVTMHVPSIERILKFDDAEIEYDWPDADDDRQRGFSWYVDFDPPAIGDLDTAHIFIANELRLLASRMIEAADRISPTNRKGCAE